MLRTSWMRLLRILGFWLLRTSSCSSIRILAANYLLDEAATSTRILAATYLLDEAATYIRILAAKYLLDEKLDLTLPLIEVAERICCFFWAEGSSPDIFSKNMMLPCTEEEKELPDGGKDQPRGAAGEEAINAPALLSQIIPNSLIPGGVASILL